MFNVTLLYRGVSTNILNWMIDCPQLRSCQCATLHFLQNLTKVRQTLKTCPAVSLDGFQCIVSIFIVGRGVKIVAFLLHFHITKK